MLNPRRVIAFCALVTTVLLSLVFYFNELPSIMGVPEGILVISANAAIYVAMMRVYRRREPV